MTIWRSLFHPGCRQRILQRVASLEPSTPARWGRMNAPQMVAHLSDQMRLCLGEVTVKVRSGPLRRPPLRWAAIYLLPWPKGRIQAPREAFATEPATWEADVGRLAEQVKRFAAQDLGGEWPDHVLFGPMRGRDWGVFCHKHFDHHLRQFGV